VVESFPHLSGSYRHGFFIARGLFDELWLWLARVDEGMQVSGNTILKALFVLLIIARLVCLSKSGFVLNAIFSSAVYAGLLPRSVLPRCCDGGTR
jgi:hypothetical protein